MSGGGGGGQTQTIQKADPWAGQQPYLLDLFAKSQALAGQPPQQFYPGTTVAAPGATTQAAQQTALGAAQNQLPMLSSGALDYTNYLMGPGRDVSNIPELQGAINAAINPLFQRFNEAGGPLSQIRQSAIGNTSGGTSTRQGIAEGIATRGLMQQAGDISKGMTWNAYQQAQEQAMRGLALAPQTAQIATMPAQVMGQVGQQQDAYQQALINEAIQRYMFNQGAPSQQLMDYSKIIQGGGFSGGQQTTSAPGPTTNPMMGALGGGMLGYGLGTAATPSAAYMLGLPALGPWGLAAGAALGYLGSR